MSIENRLERIADFFRLPHKPYDPEREVAREGQGTWRWLSLATWLMMLASLMAMYIASNNLPITIELALILLGAYMIAYELHFRRTSRLLVNWLTFSCTFLLGFIQLAPLWPLRHGLLAADNVETMSFLVISFMWLTAFRAFALRTVRDLVETILPCGSVILLTLVLSPTPLALGCMALVVFSALSLLAAEHTIRTREAHRPLPAIVRSHSKQRAGSFYSWPTLYILVLLCSIAISYAAARAELSGGLGDYLRYTLARQVVQWMQPRESFVLPETAVPLWRLSSWSRSKTPVFTAHTKFPGNWRTTVYHNYTGLWWQVGRFSTELAATGGSLFTIPIAGSGAAQTGATLVEQEITPHLIIVSALPSQFAPVQADVPEYTLRYNADRILMVPHVLRSGSRYRVISFVQPVLPMSRPGVDIAPELLQRDLQLPASLPPRVKELARKLTANDKTPYQKTRSIEQYLMYNFTYTLDVPSNWPEDFVDYFLFTSKRGFCYHFAGSMVVLCRSLGLPARLAAGYLRGEEDPDKPDTYTVREKDAHVWPEVYFAGAGWVAFEPTPAAEEQPSAFAKAWKQVTEISSNVGSGIVTWLHGHWLSAAAILFATVLLVIAVQLHLGQRYLQAYRGTDPATRIVRAYVQMRRILVEAGAPDQPALGPREFLHTLPAPLAHVTQEAEALVENYLQARFSRQTAAQAQATQAEEALNSMRQALKRRSKS